MKNRFVLKTVIFFIPFLLLLVVAEVFARSIPNSYKYKAEWMEKNNTTVETIFFGNSHMFFGVVPSMVANSFNLANPSQTLEYDEYLFKKYVKECTSLKTIVLQLDYYNFFSEELDNRGGNNWHRAIYYKLYMDCQKHSWFSKYNYESSCSIYMCSKIEKYVISKLLHRQYEKLCDRLGGGNNLKRSNRKKDNFRKERIFKIAGDIAKKYPKDSYLDNIQHLRRIVESAVDNHIRVVLVSPPLWSLYSQMLDEERLAIMYNSIDKLKKDYNVEYYDYRNYDCISDDEECFYDVDHLCDYGAERFTTILKSDLKL